MANTSKEHIILMILFQHVSVLAQLGHDPEEIIPNMCRGKNVSTSHCDMDWFKTSPPITCVKMFPDMKSFYDAEKFCLGLGARLYAGTNKGTILWMAEKCRRMGEVWVGLTDMHSEGDWRWTNGEPMIKTIWNAYEPKEGGGQHCGFIKNPNFANDKCSSKKMFLCQRPSRLGPREISMQVHWHGKGVFFEGLQAKVTCSGFYPQDGRFRWHESYNMDTAYILQHVKITHHKVYELDKEGACGLRITSTYTYTAVKYLRHLKLTCFGRQDTSIFHDVTQVCPIDSTEDAYCFVSPTLRVVARTLTKPKPNTELVQMHVKYECQLFTGYTAVIKCTSFLTPDNSIKYMFIKGGKSDVGINGLSVHTTHVMNRNKLGKMVNQTVLTLQFKPYKDLAGMEVVCYHRDAYIGNLGQPRNLCPVTIAKTGVCVKSRPLQMQGWNDPLQPNHKSEADCPSKPESRPGPRRRPRVSIKYKGAPGPIRVGSPVLVECEVVKSTSDEPVLTVHPSEAHFVWDSKIFEHSTRTQYSNNLITTYPNKEATNKDSVMLKYVFNMNEKIAGITFSCFSYDVNKKQKNAKCDTKKDKLCDATEPLKLAAQTNGASQDNTFDETRMVMNMHREDGVHFLGGIIVAKCISRRIVDGKFVWVLMKDGLLVNAYTKKHDKDAAKEKGMKISTLRLNATEALNGVTLTCYSAHFMHYHGCPTDSSSDYCTTSKPLTIVNGPKGKPELTIRYPGYPGAARVGTNVSSNCIVRIGADSGTLLWAIYMRDRTIHFKGEGDRVKNYSVRTDENGKRYIDSTIEFTINEMMNGMQIACFAYDPGKYRDTIECTVEDKYCKISRKIQVQPNSPKYSSASPVGTFILILVTLSVLLACAMGFTLREASSEKGEGPRRSPKITLNTPVEPRSIQALRRFDTQTQESNSRTSRGSTCIT